MVVAARQQLGHLITSLALQRFLEADQVGIELLDPGADLLGPPLVRTGIVPKVEREDGEGQDAIAPGSAASGDSPSRPSDRASSAQARESMA